MSRLSCLTNPGDATLAALLRRIVAKEHLALAEFHSLTSHVLGVQVRRIVRDPWCADEVVQDVYLYVWQNACVYSPERGSPRTWLHMLARSRALDRLRRSRNDSAATELDEEAHPLPFADPSKAPPEVWWHDMLRKGIRELPAPQERVIEMAFYEGYSHAEIAESTGLPLGTVKTRIRTALTSLRAVLPNAA